MGQGIPVIDRELALQQAGGNAELARELFEMLRAELPQRRAELQAAYAAGDLQALFVAAHTLHGSAIYCALPALEATVRALEVRIKSGDPEGLAQPFAALLEELERVLALP